MFVKKIIALTIIFSTIIYASSNEKADLKAKERAAKQLKIEMEKEKKYSKEQTFYQGQYYDLKGAEVNKDSISSTPEIEVDDFDMNSVYD
jgi:hypothetical protein